MKLGHYQLFLIKFRRNGQIKHNELLDRGRNSEIKFESQNQNTEILNCASDSKWCYHCGKTGDIASEYRLILLFFFAEKTNCFHINI